MTDLDIAKIKEAAERMDLSWHQCDVTVGGSPLIIMQASAYIQMCAPHTILALIARLEASEARVKTLERMDREAATHVESVICMKSKHFTGEAPYIGWKGLGLALTQDYDALKAAEARAEREAQTATSLINVIADIREKSGVGVLPMLEELADVIGVRASTAYAEGVEAAAKVAEQHVEEMDRYCKVRRVVNSIRALLKDKPNG